jgi:2-polyprenyl-6-methoxyphenol hydroxylase-like FAD-dependent oxidoreductase
MNSGNPEARPGVAENEDPAGAALTVAVAGAGLSGLCLAQSLAQAGIDVRVYERDPEPFARRQGYRITVDRYGRAALGQCLPARLSDLAAAVSGAPGGYFRFTNKDLRDAFKLTFKADPAGSGQMDRQTLRTILLIGLEDRVHYGRHAAGVTEGPDEATLHFGDGTSVTASVVVGADGSSSLLRAQVLPDHEPADTGSMALYGRTPLVVGGRPMMPPALGKSGVLAIGDEPGHAVFFTAMQFGEPPAGAFARLAPGCQPPTGGDYVMWGLVFPAHQNPLTDGQPDQSALHQQAIALARHFHPAIRELVAHAEPGYTLPVGFAVAQRPRSWPMSRATLMGDAVHVMPPFGAHGGNTALRDAALLAGKLRQAAWGGSAATALAEYQNEMAGYAFEAVGSAAKSMRRLTGGSRLQRWFLLRMLPRLHPVTVS